jgi:hypothetical protein
MSFIFVTILKSNKKVQQQNPTKQVHQSHLNRHEILRLKVSESSFEPQFQNKMKIVDLILQVPLNPRTATGLTTPYLLLNCIQPKQLVQAIMIDPTTNWINRIICGF